MNVFAAIQPALEQSLEGLSAKQLAAASQRLSSAYRREGGDFQIASRLEAKAYLAVRLPATMAAAAGAFTVLHDLCPDFTPRTMIDAGAGPGTMTLAAGAVWNNGFSAALLERNHFLRAEGKALLDQAGAQVFDYIAADLTQYEFAGRQADMVCAGYVLNELDPQQQEKIILDLWQAAQGALVITEPGTPEGFAVLLRARDTLIKAGAFIAAPCPHQLACPLANSERWCHFSVRVARSRLHKQVKGGQLGYEDEKYAYLIALRAPVARPRARAIGHPHGTKVVTLETCAQDGTFQTLTASKSHPDFKKLKKARWGEGL